MKRIVFAIILALFSTAAIAQTKLPVAFPDFENWGKQIKISGYPFLDCNQDVSEYTAMFGSGPTKAFQIRLMGINHFGEYKMVSKDASVYSLNGRKTVFYTYANITILTIELTEVQLAITYAMNGKINKSVMEELASKTNLQNLKPTKSGVSTSGIKWPGVIPAEMRLSNVESIKALGTDGTYKDVLEVKATMGPQLIQSIQSILKKYNGELTLTSTDQLDFICSEAENLDQLQSSFKNGQSVSFLYYIK